MALSPERERGSAEVAWAIAGVTALIVAMGGAVIAASSHNSNLKTEFSRQYDCMKPDPSQIDVAASSVWTAMSPDMVVVQEGNGTKLEFTHEGQRFLPTAATAAIIERQFPGCIEH